MYTYCIFFRVRVNRISRVSRDMVRIRLCHWLIAHRIGKKLLPVRTGLVAKSITSPEMLGILWLVVAHAHCSQYMCIVDNYGCSACLKPVIILL